MFTLAEIMAMNQEMMRGMSSPQMAGKNPLENLPAFLERMDKKLDEMTAVVDRRLAASLGGLQDASGAASAAAGAATSALPSGQMPQTPAKASAAGATVPAAAAVPVSPGRTRRGCGGGDAPWVIYNLLYDPKPAAEPQKANVPAPPPKKKRIMTPQQPLREEDLGTLH